jgi:cytochrome c556
MGVIAETIGREGFDLADDKDYQGHLAKLKKGARDLADAVRLNNADAARAAAGLISQSCTQCHSQFR